VAYLGWLDELREDGAIDSLVEGLARYDGKYVLLADTDLPAEEVALAYKGLWRVKAVHLEVKGYLVRTELSGLACQAF